MNRTATAVWQGTGKEGKGTLSTQSTVLKDTQYSYKSRFEDGIGTNPEELVAAAHAGCFTMKLSFLIVAAGFIAENLKTDCTITLDSGKLTNSALHVEGKVPGLTAAQFTELATKAKDECPISVSLNCNKTVDVTFVA